MKYTKHALQRFADRYPNHDLCEEEGTFVPAPKRVMKRLVKSYASGQCNPTSNRIGDGRVYVSKNDTLAIVKEQGGVLLAITFLTHPDNVYACNTYPES